MKRRFPIYFMSSGGASLYLSSSKNLESYSLVNFSRSSTKSYFDSNGVLQTASVDSLPPSYDPVTGERKGWLIEESRTRLNTIAEAPTSNENVEVGAVEHTISFYGTGTVTLSGVQSSTINGNGSFPTRTTFTFTPSAGTLTISYSGTCENVQLEEGDSATSVIEGEGSQVTRSADIADIMDLSWYNENQGTFIVEATAPKSDSSVARFFSVNSGNGLQELRLQYFGGSERVDLRTQDDNLVGSNGSVNFDTDFKSASSYSSSELNLCVDGGTVESLSSPTLPTGVTEMDIGNSFGMNHLNNYLKSIKYYPISLPESRLQALTS